MIEYPLERLKDSIGRFIVPSAALLDIQALRAQIELRRLALTNDGGAARRANHPYRGCGLADRSWDQLDLISLHVGFLA